jgi:hypothetical protein
MGHRQVGYRVGGYRNTDERVTIEFNPGEFLKALHVGKGLWRQRSRYLVKLLRFVTNQRKDSAGDTNCTEKEELSVPEGSIIVGFPCFHGAVLDAVSIRLPEAFLPAEA